LAVVEQAGQTLLGLLATVLILFLVLLRRLAAAAALTNLTEAHQAETALLAALVAAGQLIRLLAQVLVLEVLAHQGREAQEDRRQELHLILAAAAAGPQQLGQTLLDQPAVQAERGQIHIRLGQQQLLQESLGFTLGEAAAVHHQMAAAQVVLADRAAEAEVPLDLLEPLEQQTLEAAAGLAANRHPEHFLTELPEALEL